MKTLSVFVECSLTGRSDVTFKLKAYFKLLLAILLLVVITLALGGCTTTVSPRSSPLSLPQFSEGEIRSKSWRDAKGNLLECVDWKIEDLRSLGSLLVVTFGDRQTKISSCVEFYRVLDLAETKRFILIGRDYGSSALKAIELEERGRSFAFSITRESFASEGASRQRMAYLLIVEEDFTMSRGIHTWVSSLGETNERGRP